MPQLADCSPAPSSNTLRKRANGAQALFISTSLQRFVSKHARRSRKETRSTDQTLDHPRVLLLRTQVATDSAPWLPTELYLTQVKKGRWGANKEPANPLPPLFAEAAGHACAV